ncbi:MAG: tetratricopeptide repeat protein [Bacteroidota bacterium]|nr:tetratricopeptide repeat protein [Bacteroidota bacterium]
MIFRIFFLTFFLIFELLLSQSTPTLDSLKNLLKNAKTDSTQLKLYTQLSENCEYKDIPLYTSPAIALADKILKTSSSNSLQILNGETSFDKNDLPSKQKKAVLKYYGRLLNAQGTFEISQGNNKAGISFFEKALKIQNHNNDTAEMASTLNNLGINLYYLGEIKKATEALNKSAEFYSGMRDKHGVSIAYGGLSILYRSQGDVLKGIDYVFKSLKLCEEDNDWQGIASQYNTLSVYYLDLLDYQKAKDYALKSLQISKKNNFTFILSNIYSNLGFVYLKQNNTDSALRYLKLSLDISTKDGDKNGIVLSLNNIGVIYKDSKNYKEAINYFEKALQLSKEINSIDGQANSYCKLGTTYMLQNNPTKALPLALKAYELAKMLATPVDIRNSAELLKNIYESTHQYSKALEMTKLYYTMRDSILNDNTKREGLKKQFKYDYDKKAMTDSIKIVEQKKITATQLDMQQAKIKSQNIIRISLIIGILIIGFFLIFVVNRLQITKKQKLIIEKQTAITSKQKDQLEQKNKDILEGIQAAKDIQFSVFPNKAELQTVFNNYLVLFKPFDKLSGDFLWLKSVNDKVFFVVGDCTGHGIPASLFTLLANEFLNKIILQKQITSAAKILQEVNLEIYNYLQRKQTSKKSINEGMDIAICIIDKTQNVLSYSGAKIDLYAVNSNKELVITEGHRIELGKHTELINIREHEFSLSQINQFYFTSDGLKDLFKYKSNKQKFGFKGFEDFIKNNLSLPFEQQKVNLENLYHQATVDEKQIDDIIVFGFKY